MAKKNVPIGQIAIIIVLIAAAVFAYLQYSELTKTESNLIQGAQLEQLKQEFKFVVPENLSREAALDSLLKAESEVKEVEDFNLSILFFRDTLLTAKRYFIGDDFNLILNDINSREEDPKKKYLQDLYSIAQQEQEDEIKSLDYREVLRLTQLISFKKKQAFIVYDSFTIFKEKEQSYEQEGLDTSQAVAIFEKAQKAFREERYSEAATLLDQANSRLEDALKEKQRGKGLIAISRNYIVTNWPFVAIVTVVILLLIPIVFKSVRRNAAGKKVKRLKAEIAATTELIKDAQRECFKDRTITVDTYRVLEEKYKAKIAELKRKIPVLEAISRGEGPVEEKRKEKTRQGILQIEDEE